MSTPRLPSSPSVATAPGPRWIRPTCRVRRTLRPRRSRLSCGSQYGTRSKCDLCSRAASARPGTRPQQPSHLDDIHHGFLLVLELIDRDGCVLEITMRIERDAADHAVILRRWHRGKYFRAFCRVCAFHRVVDHVDGVIGERRVRINRRIEAGCVAFFEVLSLGHLRDRKACLGTGHVADRVTVQIDHLLRACAVAAQHLRCYPEIARLLGQWPGGGVRTRSE